MNTSSHRWFLNGRQRTSYTLGGNANLPTTIYDQDGINIVLFSAMGYSATSDFFNATSELNTTIGALIIAGITTTQCGTNAFRSENLNLSQLITVTSMLLQ